MARGSKVKNSATNPKAANRGPLGGRKASSVKKGKGNAMSATRGLHGGRRKPV
jgi:hypothetical protein